MGLNTAQGQTIGDTAKALREEYRIADVLRTMAGVELHKNGAELAGPCPRCGGRDRFYVTADGKSCACRKTNCHTQRMDVVGLVAWLQNVPMHEAVDILAGRRSYSPVRQTATVTSVTSDSSNDSLQDATSADWRKKAALSVLRAQERLYSETDGARAAQAYLLSRGLQPDTWRAFGLGYDRARVPGTKDYAPAVAWPIVHESDGQTYGVRYRFLETQAGANGKQYRYTSLTGTRNTGRLFGVPALPAGVLEEWDSADRLHAESVSCLCVCEGEFNAMSVWQACAATGVDVLSFGSEAQRSLPAWAIAIASHYGAVIVWVDDTEKAQEVGRQLPQAVALRSLTQDGHKWDSNALLVAGKLGGLVQAARLSVMHDRRESVLWQLWDARDTLDASQRNVAQRLAAELGKSVMFDAGLGGTVNG